MSGKQERRPKFTPGPWRVYTGHRKVIPIGSEAGSIATASGGRAATCYTGEMSREEALANARLIAAAPEMYEALRLALDYLYDYVPHATQAPVISAVENGLAKAEGRAVPDSPKGCE